MRAIMWKFVKLLIGLAILAAPIVYVLLVAGLIGVPLVGGFVYQPPQADHVVTASAPLDSESLQSLTFSESMLTASLRLGLDGEAGQWFEAGESQVAVIDGHGVELFLPLANNAQRSALTIVTRLDLADGALTPVVTSFHLGRLPVSPKLMNAIVESSLKSALASFNAELAKVARIEAVAYQDGNVVVTGTLTASPSAP
ncbi:MAG: hypothetical protein AAB429_02060 [Patescibacteria group bacterium]